MAELEEENKVQESQTESATKKTTLKKKLLRFPKLKKLKTHQLLDKKKTQQPVLMKQSGIQVPSSVDQTFNDQFWGKPVDKSAF